MDKYEPWLKNMLHDMDSVVSDLPDTKPKEDNSDNELYEHAEIKLKALHAALDNPYPTAIDLYSIAKFMPIKRQLEISAVNKKVNKFDNKNKKVIVENEEDSEDDSTMDKITDLFLKQKLGLDSDITTASKSSEAHLANFESQKKMLSNIRKNVKDDREVIYEETKDDNLTLMAYDKYDNNGYDINFIDGDVIQLPIHHDESGLFEIYNEQQYAKNTPL